MPLTLSGGGTSVPLFTTQEDEIANEAGLISTSMFASSTDETFLFPITADDTQSPSGTVTGEQVARTGGFSNDPLRALAEWVSRYESLVDGNQTGNTLSSPRRNRSIGGFIRSSNWSHSSEAALEVEYSFEFLRGRGFDISIGTTNSGSSPEGVNPRGGATLAGQPLGEVQTNRVTREQDIMSINVPQIDVEIPDVGLDIDTGYDDNLLIATGGPVRRINLEGRVTSSQTNLNSFERGIRGRLGDMMNTVTYREGFPGRTMSVAVENFSCTDPAGRPHEREYRIELIEGMQISDVLDQFDFDFSDVLD